MEPSHDNEATTDIVCSSREQSEGAEIWLSSGQSYYHSNILTALTD